MTEAWTNLRVPLGVLAVASWLAHAVWLSAQHRLGDALWLCHLSALLVGVGALRDARVALRLGTLFLLFGLPLYAHEVLHGRWSVTSMGTHLGGLVVGVHALRCVGWRAGAAWWSLPWLLIGQSLGRWVAPPALDVNLVYGTSTPLRALAPTAAHWLVLGDALVVSVVVVLDLSMARLWPERT